MNEAELRWLLRDKYGLSLAKATADEALRLVRAQGGEARAAELTQDLQRLASGEPLAYVIGWVPFLQARIDLSERTLIPRPETEFWVQQVISEIQSQVGVSPQPLKILDLCCGSGCIGISVLQALPQSVVTFSDISSAAVRQTERNLELNKISEERFLLKTGNLFEAVAGQFDYVLCNPPYVDLAGEYSGDLKFEPQEAIFAQKEGLELIEEIIIFSEKYLIPNGKLILEFGKGQETEVAKMAKEASWKSIQIRKDHYGVERWVELS